MNPEEEKSTDWWAKFLFDTFNADIIIRNAEIGSNAPMEFDAITVQWSKPGNRFESDPLVGCVETKLANKRPREQADALIKQLKTRDDKHAFNYLSGMMDQRINLDQNELPKWAGYIEATQPITGGPLPSAIMRQAPRGRFVGYGKERGRLLAVVRQFYDIASKMGEKALFVKCQRRACSFFYGFGYGERPPGFEGDYTERHSRFCPAAPDKGNSYAYLTTEFNIGRRVFSSNRFFKWLR